MRIAIYNPAGAAVKLYSGDEAGAAALAAEPRWEGYTVVVLSNAPLDTIMTLAQLPPLEEALLIAEAPPGS